MTLDLHVLGAPFSGPGNPAGSRSPIAHAPSDAQMGRRLPGWPPVDADRSGRYLPFMDAPVPPRPPLPEAFGARIQALLMQFLATPGQQHELRDVAAFGALPLYWDVGGCMALRPDGRVVSVVWSAPEQSFRDAPAGFALAALVSGTARHPELAALLPGREPHHRDCPNCASEGLLEGNAFCGVCFGLGFVNDRA